MRAVVRPHLVRQRLRQPLQPRRRPLLLLLQLLRPLLLQLQLLLLTTSANQMPNARDPVVVLPTNASPNPNPSSNLKCAIIRSAAIKNITRIKYSFENRINEPNPISVGTSFPWLVQQEFLPKHFHPL